jgi:hypothetical protein
VTSYWGEAFEKCTLAARIKYMKIVISKEISRDLSVKLQLVNPFSKFANRRLKDISFGKGVNDLYIMINSMNPEIGFREFETGVLIHSKYVKSKKYLEFDYKLNHKQIIDAANDHELIDLIGSGLQKALIKIREIEIQYFDVDRFENEMMYLIEQFKLADYHDPNDVFQFQGLSENTSPPHKMDSKLFWDLVDQSKKLGKDYSDQIKILINKLSELEEDEIIGFEFTLRDVLSESAHYNILAAAKIINDFVSDDDFLYLRCRLIAEGKELYYQSIENPEILATTESQYLEIGGEEILSVSDFAFEKKMGSNTDKEMPRDVAFDYLNYDTGEEIKGNAWREADLPVKYPKLWGRYRT